MRKSSLAAAQLAAVVTFTTLMVAAEPAPAVDLNKSRLTAVEPDKCRKIRRHRDGDAWLCPGIAGYPVYFAEGDLRQMLAFGPAPQRRRSATQTLGPFNSIFQGRRRAMIEWRVEHDIRRRTVPYATIVRYFTSRDGDKGEMLVITKVDPKQSCQLAVIDARTNADAMALARAWAIAEARKRDCPEEPVVLGQPAKEPK